MYRDPFVKKYKNKYALLRYNKWTEGPHKQLFLYGDTQVILAFILQLMGNINYGITFINYYLIYFN